MKWFRPSNRLAALLVTAGVVTSGCVQPDEPGLTISPLDANLVFGVELPEEAPTPQEDAFERFVPPPAPKQALRPRPDPRPVLPPPPPPACPDPEGFPELEAPFTIPRSVRPVEGLYRYRVSAGQRQIQTDENGEQTFNDIVEPVGEDVRAIRNVEDLPRPEWTPNPAERPGRQVFRFEEVRLLSETRTEVGQGDPDSGNLYLVTVWQLDTDAPQVESPSGTGAGGITGSIRVGDPERGLAIMEIKVIDAEGNEVETLRTFRPRSGLLMLPFPVTSGEEFRSVAVDESGRTITQTATVGRRLRMNACGEPLEGWAVDAVQTFQTGTQSAINYDNSILVAPQFGGIVLAEVIHNQLNSAVIHFELNSKTPEPLPDNGLPG